MINMDCLGKDDELMQIVWENGELVQIMWAQMTKKCKLSGKVMNS